MDEAITIQANHLPELLARLTDRRIAVEKELAALGEAKKGTNEIFRHCRGFERAYSVLLNEAQVAFKIRAVVEGNLPETLRRIPIEKRFNKNYVREVCREADGYQAHLVSPERGIRRLVQEAMALTTDHVHRFVDEVHMVLAECVRDAARRSVLTESGVGPNLLPREAVGLRGFENAVIAAASNALDEWRAEAHKVADTMVQMECDYVTPSYFRELEKQFQAEQQQGGGQERLDQLATGNVTADNDDDSDSESAEVSPTGPPRSASATGRDGSPYRAGGGFAMPAGGSAGGAGANTRDDLKAGWLEKRTGESSNLAALPVNSWKWQRRWFVLAVESGYLYYFKSPDQMSSPGVSPKVTINLRECIVEDFQPDAATGGEKKSTQKLDNNAGSVSLLIRIMHKNPNKSVAKNHHQMILRADNASEKYDWLARLRHATEPGVGGRARIAGKQQQGGGAAAAAAEPEQEKGLFGRTATKISDTFTKFSGWGGSKVGYVLQEGSIQDMDEYYERLGNFAGLYARHVFDRMSKTVPKAIILCQVIRSRDRLLDQLYNYLSNLKPVEMEALLAEDPTVNRRRTAAQQASRDLADAQLEVRKIEEVRASESPRQPNAHVSVRSLLLAGAFPLVPKDKVPTSVDPVRLYGEYTPVMLLQGVDANAPPLLRPPSTENGVPGSGRTVARSSSDGGSRPAAAGPPQLERPSSSSGSASKPRRQPPPPPPKM